MTYEFCITLDLGVLGHFPAEVDYQADGYKPLMGGVWIEIEEKMIDISMILTDQAYDIVYEACINDLRDRLMGDA